MIFEHRIDPLLPPRRFAVRAAGYPPLSAACIVGAVGIGVAGDHFLGGLPWIGGTR